MNEPDAVERFFNRAAEHGVAMYLICDRAGVARSTPSRWKTNRNGATLTALNQLNNALSCLIAETPAQTAA